MDRSLHVHSALLTTCRRWCSCVDLCLSAPVPMMYVLLCNFLVCSSASTPTSRTDPRSVAS